MGISIQAEIITIGDEILIGQTVDTNSAWLGQNLDAQGFQVVQISSVSDQPEHIVRALKQAMDRADLVVITGGLGPTLDDRTKQTLADFFDMKLVVSDQVAKNIKKILSSRNVPFIKTNEDQALIPDDCLVLNNMTGTAPGMLFQRGAKVVVSLPGVPFEMKSIAENELFPWLRENLVSERRLFKMIMTTGFAESVLASKLASWESGLKDNYSLAYLPSPGIVKLRLTAWGKPPAKLLDGLNAEIEKLGTVIPEAIYSYVHENLEEHVGKMLKSIKMSVGTAESCTGGNIASLFVSIPGSSDYYKGSIIAYAYDTKRDILDVDQKQLNEFGAVSQVVCKEMADHARRTLNVDYSIATSGVAGPEGGTKDKPVGFVWIAVASSKRIVSKRFYFGNHRGRNITRASLAGLNLLRQLIIEEHQDAGFGEFHKSNDL
ncbi:MAG: CinA family nicotinamide mononucleotide deamidase-related protein [Bacteroidota bacterium]|nr:CinA family nicotinamide mononucleotide deamidase-related protein [Bacteroidota bacterium]